MYSASKLKLVLEHYYITGVQSVRHSTAAQRFGSGQEKTYGFPLKEKPGNVLLSAVVVCVCLGDGSVFYAGFLEGVSE